jgi:hypothetical protein
MTAVDTAQFSAQEYNLYIRDNLNEMAAAKVTALSQYFVTAGHRSLDAFGIVDSFVLGTNTTTSGSYTMLSGGPFVTTDTNKSALLFFGCAMSNSTTGASCSVSVRVSGNSTVDANNNWRILHDGRAANQQTRTMGIHYFQANLHEGKESHPELRAGLNTFTMQCRVVGGTGSFSRRYIAVMPL